MCDANDLDRLFAKISARLYPITGLRIYNPDGKFTISVDEDGQAAMDRPGEERLAASHPGGAFRPYATVGAAARRCSCSTRNQNTGEGLRLPLSHW